MKNSVVKKSFFDGGNANGRKSRGRYWVLDKVMEVLLPYYCRGCGKTGSLICEECRAEIKIIGEIRGQVKIVDGARGRAKAVKEIRGRAKPGEKIEMVGGKEIELGDLEALFVGSFREGALEKLVKDYKFRSVKRISEILVSILDEAVPEDFWTKTASLAKTEVRAEAGRAFGEQGEVIVVPLPTVKKHIRERGFDHTKRLAKEFAERRGLEACPLLRRVNKTVQVGADEETRERQAAEAYAVDARAVRKAGLSKGEQAIGLEPEKVYLLLDDVWTTGASMRAAAKKLREAGAKKIYGAVVETGR